MTTEHLLDLSDLDRDTVKLPNGSTIELHNPNELGPLDEFKLRKLIAAIANYDPSQAKTEEDAQKASDDLHSLAAMIVVDAPEELDDRSCAAIFSAWISKHVAADPPTRPRRPQDRKPKKKPTSTGAKSSPGSKPSTAATRKRGSTARSGR